jgi:fructose 1,6-bisphosphatase
MSFKIHYRNNLRRISTLYVRGYLQGSENGRVATIAFDDATSFYFDGIMVIVKFNHAKLIKTLIKI